MRVNTRISSALTGDQVTYKDADVPTTLEKSEMAPAMRAVLLAALVCGLLTVCIVPGKPQHPAVSLVN